MSALARWLHYRGIRVSGSDVAASEQTEALIALGIPVNIGHDSRHVTSECDVVIYNSAIPQNNPERLAARAQGLTLMNNFDFLSQITAHGRAYLITGTHGKSTTTALVGLAAIAASLDPTVFVGSRVPAFGNSNVRFGQSDLFIIEGDEYDRHFLTFQPTGIIINNIEHDHPDTYPRLEDMLEAFRTLLHQVKDRGVVIANADDPRVSTLIGEERFALEERGIRVVTFGFGSHADERIVDEVIRDGEQHFSIRSPMGIMTRCHLSLPGRHMVANAAAAFALGRTLGILPETLFETFATYRGIWRRFEKIADRDDMTVISDYAHHPTAIRVTLEAARAFYPGRRLLVCFQPHQRARTQELFLDFLPAFDAADQVILVEIYDVAGRNDVQEPISSRDLHEALIRHDADRGVRRLVEYATDPDDALARIKRLMKPGDVMMIMGAGDIYLIAPKVLV